MLVYIDYLQETMENKKWKTKTTMEEEWEKEEEDGRRKKKKKEDGVWDEV